MKSVLISIRPKWCELIASGKKTVEVRKTRPKIGTPFKVYIYCTNSGRPLVYGDVPCAGGWTEKYTQTYGYSRTEADRIWGVMNGKVIGEFVCDKINSYVMCGTNRQDMRYLRADEKRYVWTIDYGDMCLSEKEFADYGGRAPLYGWHISDLKIYDEPRELSEFYRLCDGTDNTGKCWECDKAVGEEHDCGVNGMLRLVRPPQSWCYVEEI